MYLDGRNCSVTPSPKCNSSVWKQHFCPTCLFLRQCSHPIYFLFSRTLWVCLWKTIKILWLLIDPRHDIQKPQNVVVFSMSLGRQTALCKIAECRKEKEICLCERAGSHLPDAQFQQVRALIDLRLRDCALIKERSCSVPFFLLIWALFIWFRRGHSWAQCVNRSVPSVNVWCARWVYFPSDTSSSFHSEIWEVAAQQGVSDRSVSHRGPTCNRQDGGGGKGQIKWSPH